MSYSAYASERTTLRTTGHVQVLLADSQANARMKRGFDAKVCPVLCPAQNLSLETRKLFAASP